MPTSLAQTFFRAFFGFGFGLVCVYFLVWAMVASTVPDWEAVLRFSGCFMLSGLGSIYFIYIYHKSDVYLPKTQSLLFYSFMAVCSLLTGALLVVHVEAYQAIPDRMRLPNQLLAIVVYLVFFIFSIIRLTEARFLPSLGKNRVSDELIK